ncbi:MAG: hypothetical protein SO132_03110 [Candidatus Enteromonas sp.]|nr:hypothetical protein [Mollicutes bacterium]MDD7715577.1 hypothetical protein [Mollicutes bacterium]MDY4935742.1 hypothetical protein [Candidatus Enteromonas sp.]
MNTNKHYIIENECKQKVKDIVKKTRRCLLNNGKSPDSHIYELESSFFDYDKNKDKEYLLKLREYYESLSRLERMVFVNDCLEMGRHYKFWYLSFFYSRDYQKTLCSLYHRLSKAF